MKLTLTVRRLRLLSRAAKLLAVAARHSAHDDDDGEGWTEEEAQRMDSECQAILDEVHDHAAWDDALIQDIDARFVRDCCPDHSQACQLAAQAATLAQEWEDNWHRLLCQGCWNEGHDHIIGTICQTCGH